MQTLDQQINSQFDTASPDFLVQPSSDIEREFKRFHQSNPHVYIGLLDLAQRAISAGATKLGIGALVETLRYSAALQTKGDAYKINNNHRPLYARLLVANHPHLKPLFEMRARPSVSHYADDRDEFSSYRA